MTTPNFPSIIRRRRLVLFSIILSIIAVWGTVALINAHYAKQSEGPYSHATSEALRQAFSGNVDSLYLLFSPELKAICTKEQLTNYVLWISGGQLRKDVGVYPGMLGGRATYAFTSAKNASFNIDFHDIASQGNYIDIHYIELQSTRTLMIDDLNYIRMGGFASSLKEYVQEYK